MKKIITLSALIFLTACSPNGDEKNSTEDLDTKPKVISQRIDTTSGIDEVCGGESEMKCHQGLSCVFDFDTADGHGLCAEKIVNEQDCENIYKPVCGLNDGTQKYTYFNECQMERHGAELVKEGKCEIDETVAGNCEAKARGFSNCFETTTGYEFDGKTCAKKVVATCDDAAEIPFDSLESCENSCL